MARTLISFLGTTNYEEARYQWPGTGELHTAFVAVAMAGLWQADRIIVLATEEAEAHNGEALRHAARSHGQPEPTIRRLPPGHDEQELWQHFGLLRDTLQEAAGDEVLIDITHGFRAQPFFAAAALSVLRASGHGPEAPRLAYGEFRKGDGPSPIWDLSLATELLDWAQALGLFLRTGVADAVVALGREAQKREAQLAQRQELATMPQFGRLISAIETFAADLATIRVASLITGYEQHPERKDRAESSAAFLQRAIADCREEVAERVPPLSLVLDQLEATVQPLIADRLASPEGQRAQEALTNLYLQLNRYPEAAVVAREARVSHHALDHRGVEVNATDFDANERGRADRSFQEHDPIARDLAAIRNDIEHGGFRQQPIAGKDLEKQVHQIAERAQHEPLSGEEPARQGRVWFVSRHPGAVEWARRQGVEVEEWVDHLDPEQVQPGDVVIGSLPVDLAAEVCERGAQYWHLVLKLPRDWRGQELSAEELEQCQARLQPFQIQVQP